MEIIFVIIGIFLLVTVILPWINLAKISTLRKEFDVLRHDVEALVGKRVETAVVATKEIATVVQPEPQIEIPHKPETESLPAGERRLDQVMEDSLRKFEERYGAGRKPEAMVFKTETIKEKSRPASARTSLEQNIGTKITVWIGALALAFAAFYMVKYSIDNNLISASLRLVMGGVFGCALISLGQFMALRPQLARNERIPQALVGAGIVALYVCLFAAFNVYHFLSPMTAFIGMIAVTVVAVVMSLRHGAPIALFGIIGGMVTPLMVGSDEPNALLLFAYLFGLYVGILFILSQKQWWGLAIVALIGAIIWPWIWVYDLKGQDTFIIVCYTLAICLASLATSFKTIQKETNAPSRLHAFNILAIAGASFVVFNLGFQIQFGLFEWAVLQLFTLAIMVLAFFRPESYRNYLWPKLVIDLYLFSMWLETADHSFILPVLAFMAIPYVVVSGYLIRKVMDPRHWSVLQVLFLLGTFLITYFELKDVIVVGGISPWGVIALVLASLSIFMAREIIHFYKADDKIQNFMVSVYSLSASSFLSLGFAIVLDFDYLPFAFATQILATLLIYKATNVEFLKTIISMLAIVFIGLNYEHIYMFAELITASLFDLTLTGWEAWTIYESTLKLAIPAVFIGLAYLYWEKIGAQSMLPVGKILSGITLLLLVAYDYILLRSMFHPGQDVFMIEAGFIERNFVTLEILVLGLLLNELRKIYSNLDLMLYIKILVCVAVARLVYFDLVIYNPYFAQGQTVGEMFILNGITLAYGMGIAACLLALRSKIWTLEPGERTLFRFLSFVFLFAFVTLNVTQIFNGAIIRDSGEAMSAMELYSYSIVWLLTGIFLVTYGIIRDSKIARSASLVFVLMSVAKVFFVDAAELEGLYRVFSFLGLGVSLIGLSFFYSRFVFAKNKAS